MLTKKNESPYLRGFQGFIYYSSSVAVNIILFKTLAIIALFITITKHILLVRDVFAYL